VPSREGGECAKVRDVLIYPQCLQKVEEKNRKWSCVGVYEEINASLGERAGTKEAVIKRWADQELSHSETQETPTIKTCEGANKRDSG